MPLRRSFLVLPAVGVLLLAGCASGAAGGAPAPAASTPTAGSALTVDNCGTKVAFPSAPKRVVTIKSTSTEMLLALGLGDRIVGTAFQDGPLPKDLAGKGAALKSIADQVPSEEKVLQLEPDLVYGGWESNFSADGAGERSELSSLGVATYVSPAACKEPKYKPAKLGWNDVFGEIREVGDIFRVPEAATRLVADQKKQLGSIRRDDRGLTALWYSSGSDTPYVGAGIGNPELVLDTVGLTNIAGDVKDTWTPLSWEAIVAADPDVIVLVDASWNTAQKKMDALAADPATANLSAVKNSRYLVVPFAASEAGVRSVSAAADLSRQLAALPLP